MENIYRRTQTTVSLINYHFVFCPRYRRKIFLIHFFQNLKNSEQILTNACLSNKSDQLTINYLKKTMLWEIYYM